MPTTLQFSYETPLNKIAGQLFRRSGAGETEAGAFLLGKLDGESRRVEHVVYFDDVDPDAYHYRSIRFDTTKMGAVYDICNQLGLDIVADIHTHPEEAFQSATDQAHPVKSVIGHVALVLPYDGRYRTIEQIGIFTLNEDGTWNELPRSENRSFLRLDEVAPAKNNFDRADLLLLNKNVGTADRSERFAQITVGLKASSEACWSASGQAALLSAVALLSRFARGGVQVNIAANPELFSKPGRRLSEELLMLGAQESKHSPIAWILIGDVASTPGFSMRLVADQGKFGCVPASSSARFEDSYVAGAIAATALAVGEIFRTFVLNRVEVLPRTRMVALISPPERDRFASSFEGILKDLWLAGLGHLGNAYAWVIALTPDLRPTLRLQDPQDIDVANASTQLFFTQADEGQSKASTLAHELKAFGLIGSADSRYLDENFVKSNDSLPLISGFDNVEARQSLARSGASVIIDGGLGSTSSDFSSFSVVKLDDSSTAVDAFINLGAAPQSQKSKTAAYQEIEDIIGNCGMLTLAETSVAVPFVGMFVATIAVTQMLRTALKLPAATAITGDVLAPQPIAAELKL